ncbi:hypothetical protein BDB00DRAFT_124407 [Zychaea mexicana]|uniref:uncharacterized protein n=1 Tax=Zychaea mexicana TaxID=64656 RepID=UPI0022FEC4C1|nr:uncharacterized protein BDB00DRAFT_124407 [Zychaea mexicana]KAI9496556.1 hypothetical protein BDB00DRAFT_124407 [Zychaea mexicana]
MPRFWSRVLHPFRHHHIDQHQNYKKLNDATTDNSKSHAVAGDGTTIVIGATRQQQAPLCSSSGNAEDAVPSLSYSSSSCLTESEVYREDLVKVEALHFAQSAKMETFFWTWNEELERIFEKCRWALDSLTCTIDELSHEICTIASPLQNTDCQSVHHARQFISSYLKEWQDHLQQQEQLRHDAASTKELSELMKTSFDAYFESLHSKVLATEDTGLSQCIQRICQWEHDLFLYKQYFESQMTILKDASHSYEAAQYLLQTRWDRRYNQCMSTSQALEDRMKTLLEQSSPSRDDFTCAICLAVLSEPVTIGTCLHTFCRSCIQQIYCTCTLASCSSPCHRATRRQKSLSQRRQRRQQQHRYKHPSTSSSKKRQKLPACQCYNDESSSIPLPKHHSCPLCRSPFTLKDCAVNVALDNFISLYFPHEEKRDDDDDTRSPAGQRRQRQQHQQQQQKLQKRRSAFYTAVQQLWAPHGSEHPSYNNNADDSSQSTAAAVEAPAALYNQGTTNNDSNEPTSRTGRHQQDQTVRPESRAIGIQDIVNSDLYTLVRRSWWL